MSRFVASASRFASLPHDGSQGLGGVPQPLGVLAHLVQLGVAVVGRLRTAAIRRFNRRHSLRTRVGRTSSAGGPALSVHGGSAISRSSAASSAK